MIIALSIYLFVGMFFAVWFVAIGHRVVDASSADARWSVRMLWLPVALLIGLCLGSNAASAKDAINTTLFGNLAIEGYDTVAYFTENRALKGKREFETTWMQAKWRFASAEHRDLFVADPDKYAPQYGGYCAYAVSQNYTAGIEPEQFELVGDKLYLNYNAKIKSRWLKQRDEFIIAADANWPGVID